MTLSDTFSYFTALVAIAIAPGPVVLMLMVRAASNDVKGAAGFGFGFALGGVFIVAAVCFGLGAWLSAVPAIFEYSKYVMMAYFIYLAIGIWRGGFDMNGECDLSKGTRYGSIATGLAICFISPYMMLLFPLVLPEMMDITTIQLPDFAIVGTVTFLALSTGAFLIVIFAAQIKRLVRSDFAATVLNKSLATILVTVGGLMAFG